MNYILMKENVAVDFHLISFIPFFQLDYRAAVRELEGLKDENEMLRRK